MFDVQSFLWKPFEHLRSFFAALAITGLLTFLYYSFLRLGVPYGDLDLGDALHLAIVAFVVGSYVIALNAILLANAAIIFKPVLFLFSKLVNQPVRIWRSSLFHDKDQSEYAGESFEHVYSRSLTWIDYLQFAPIVILVDIFVFFNDTPASFSGLFVASIFLGGTAGYVIIFINAHSRLSKQLEEHSYCLHADERLTLEAKISETKYFSWVFGAISALFPLVLVGAGDEIVDSAMSTAGYRAESSNIYVKDEFCPVVLGALGSRRIEGVEGYCVFSGVETLLFRMGEEVVVSNPDDQAPSPVFIPKDKVVVQHLKSVDT